MKIHAFGDSFTNAFNDETAIHVKEYIKWKGYKPKSYVDILSEYFECSSINYAVQGWDNYSIMESVCKNHNLIKPNDIVIINWTSSLRFRVVGNHQVWYSIVPAIDKYKNVNISKKTLNEIILNRESKKYIDEVVNWSNLLHKTFRENKILQWSPNFYGNNIKIKLLNDFEKINEETNGEVDDKHYSEKGHLDLANKMIDLLENGQRLI